MMNSESVCTFDKLCSEIIAPLLSQICQAHINYSVKKSINGMPAYRALNRKYDEYWNKTLDKMQGGRLDRHKWASCICGAIVETQPLTGYQGATILKKANEIFAFHVGLNTVKMCMVYEWLKKLNLSENEKISLKEHIKVHFEMEFPDNIKDTQEYSENFENALYWSHFKCDITGEECFRYDIWAYAKLFYHLELYNRPVLQKCCQDYLREHGVRI